MLAVLLAEANLLAERRGSPPLLILDDVLSELDEDRRRALIGALPAEGQTFVSATSGRALPDAVPPPVVTVTVRREHGASIAEAA